MNAVLVWLSRSNPKSIANLLRSMELAERNFLRWSPADIIVFHEEGFDQDAVMQGASRLNLPGKLSFATVDFSGVKPGFENLAKGQRGYRHMCHFFGNDIFLRPELSSYDYFVRLDDDSYILSPVKYNVFKKMENEGLKYVYRMVMNEAKSVSKGLLETTKSFFDSNEEFRRANPSISRVKLYYTNFEICALKWFRSEPWQRYFGAIDAAGGIWSNRWGDAPIRWLGLQYMLTPKELFALRSMKYRHQFLLRRGFMRRLPLEYAKYVLSIILYDLFKRN